MYFDLSNGNFYPDNKTISPLETMIMNDYSPLSERQFMRILKQFEYIVDEGYNPNLWYDTILAEEGVKETNFTQKQMDFLTEYITKRYKEYHRVR